MAGPKKFGTFAGVFTPSILTILGVIMYLRMGWIVGNGGIWIVLGIIALAHIISITTGLSISSISTDRKVGAGGVYYVLSRSLGLPIGGALGLALFVATAFSIALYMVGFAEIFNEYIQYGVSVNGNGEIIYQANYTNTLRVTGSLGLLVLTIIAFISTSVALKTQFFVLAAIVLSLFSIFLGNPENVSVFEVAEGADTSRAGFATIFAIFFPAVTGFTAGVAMSGDLKDAKKSIPLGTMGAIIVGLIVYTILALFLSYSIDPDTLINNPKAIIEMAAVGILVYLGVWGATLSSALGGILGGPRILQAMSIDKITPKIFAKGVGKGNEPRNALILTVIIAEVGILIGDLNVIAEVVSMFYLAAYGFINISFFLESWASADFKPSFKIKKWVGLLGFIITFTIMSQLNMVAMIAAFVIIGGIYFYLSRKQISLGTGDIWQSVWSTIVKKGLKRMEEGVDHKRNWKPNMLLFSGKTEYRSQTIELSKAISGQYGIVTNFDLEENPDATVLFPKNKKSVNDEELEKYGIFGRQLEVQNTFKGIESIVCTFGFSGVEPNTVMMPWPGKTEETEWFTSMTRKLMDLDYNILYLDYDKRWGFRKKKTIDLWWRGIGTNSELMLMLGKFIVNSPDWSQAELRILVINESNVNRKLIESRINNLIDVFRIDAKVKIVNNEVDQKPLYELMKTYSQDTDLVIVGIPEISDIDTHRFVSDTNELVSTIGTTLLVRASSQFDEADLSFEKIDLKEYDYENIAKETLPLTKEFGAEIHDVFFELDVDLDKIAKEFLANGIHPLQSFHQDLLAKVKNKMDTLFEKAAKLTSRVGLLDLFSAGLKDINTLYNERTLNQMEEVCQSFAESIDKYILEKEQLLYQVERKVKITSRDEQNMPLTSAHKVRFRNALQRVWLSQGISEEYDELLKFGYKNLLVIHQTKNSLQKVVWNLLEADSKDMNEFNLSEKSSFFKESIGEVVESTSILSETFYVSLRNKERNGMNVLMELLSKKNHLKLLQDKFPILSNKKIQQYRTDLTNFGAHLFRNSILFGYHLEAGLTLIRYSIQVNELLKKLMEEWQRDLAEQLQNEIKVGFKNTEQISSLIKDGKLSDLAGYHVSRHADVFIDISEDLNNFTKVALEKIRILPESVELISASSLNTIQEIQNQKIVTEDIKLRDITEFLFQTKFLEPLSGELKIFEGQLKRQYNSLLGVSNMLEKRLNEFVVEEDADSLSQATIEANEQLNIIQEDVASSLTGMYGEIMHKREEIQSDFDINQIIEQIEALELFVKESKSSSVIVKGIKRSADYVSSSYNKAYNFVANQRKQKSSIEYVRKYSDLISEQDVIAGFIENISAHALVPYSYKQVFSEGYYLNEGAFEFRASELKLIENGIERINNGAKGSILVLGSSRSGKSSFTEFAISKFLAKKPIYLTLGADANPKNVFVEALQRATGLKGSVRNIIEGLPTKSVLIFNDIEQWALRSTEPYENYTKIVKLISDFSEWHYFFINANIHSYKLVRNNSDISKTVISTIILPAIKPAEMLGLIKARHLDSGMSLVIENEKEAFLKENRLNKFITNTVAGASGNIGMGLQQWLASIVDRKESDLYFERNPTNDFPLIKDIDLQNLIYHLFIFKKIGKKDLIKLYGITYENWIERWVEALLNVKLLSLSKNGNIEIKAEARPYVEKWLNELGYIS